MKQARVLVLNPNSSEKVTQAIDRAVQGAVAGAGCAFQSVTAADGPPGVVTQEDYEQATALVVHYVQRHAQEAQAFVIACFSDPGVAGARVASGKPVVGLGEAGLRAALERGRRVGVLAIADAAIPRHLRHWRSLGLDQQVAGERALNLRVDQAGDPAIAFDRLREAGRLLREQDGADALLLGCAGMADLRQPLEQALGLPVVDPCQAAAAAALKAVRGA
jgi:Asp/Glu/hydantoin racemase